jgi:predicted metal-dependent HD superfamily phosphohydrolase
MVTAGHATAPGDDDGALLCDADLSVLAQTPQRYADYTVKIRQEYAHVPEADFRAGRAAVLRALLDLPALFRRPELAGWEQPARANLRAELAALTAGPG